MENETETREFSIESVISVTSGRFLVDDIIEIYEILNWMTGDNAFTHQLPRFKDECAPFLLKNHPEIVELSKNIENMDNLDLMKKLLKEHVSVHGKALKIIKIPSENHIIKDPITELSEMRNGKGIVIVEKE